MAERIRTRFLVVGSGVAGLHTAWRASADADVMVLTKRSLFDSATAYAQGGIAAALGAGDSPELHRLDTLATGGCGQVYRYTTNPQVATGDGFAIAHRAGARLADMEFVQFHPTALDTPENPLQLISEAVRGEGAVLLNEDGKRFMLERHRLAELAPRDVVAREIFRERVGGRHVFLDARMLGKNFEQRFPGIFAICRARGVDPSVDLIPVTPAAHYMMGGIVTDLRGRASLNRLYACGEVSRTGVHGANRLASNSLLEGLVFAERVARDMIDCKKQSPPPRKKNWDVPALRDRGAAQVAADTIRQVMWDYCGIDRSAKGLRLGRTKLEEIESRLPEGATEEANMVQTSRLIADAALLRKGSRGGHARTDFPRAKRKWTGRHIEW